MNLICTSKGFVCFTNCLHESGHTVCMQAYIITVSLVNPQEMTACAPVSSLPYHNLCKCM